MARTLKLVATVLVSVVVLATAVQAHEGECRLIRGADTPDITTDDVSVCQQSVWFHRADTPIGNTAALGGGSFPTWNTTQPSGPGAAYVATSTFHQSTAPWDPTGTGTFDGSYTGNIDTLAVKFHLLPFAKQTPSDTSIDMNARLVVDGQEVWSSEGINTPFPEGAGPGVKTSKFAFVNLYDTFAQMGLAGEGREHTVRFSIVGLGLATASGVLLYDSTQSPSGMIFNLDELEGYTLVDAGAF